MGDELFAAPLELRDPSLGGSDLMRDAIRRNQTSSEDPRRIGPDEGRNQTQSDVIRGSSTDRT
jgi:hypothetical protein